MSATRVALVTGGGRGIGRASALALATAGCDVAVAARSGAQLAGVVAEIETAGRRGLALEADLTRPDQLEAAFAELDKRLGPPLVLVNNAGQAPSAPFLRTTPELWRQTLELNATAAFLCCQRALPAMQQAGWGRIVNVASTAARVGFRYTAAYTASKHALLGLTRALAAELCGSGITVNAVCPGFVRSAITDEAAGLIAGKTGRSHEQALAELAAMNPHGRLLEPEEVARVVAFLATDEAASVTGQAWNIDGGAVQS